MTNSKLPGAIYGLNYHSLVECWPLWCSFCCLDENLDLFSYGVFFNLQTDINQISSVLGLTNFECVIVDLHKLKYFRDGVVPLSE